MSLGAVRARAGVGTPTPASSCVPRGFGQEKRLGSVRSARPQETPAGSGVPLRLPGASLRSLNLAHCRVSENA